jgi:hypothetical protein
MVQVQKFSVLGSSWNFKPNGTEELILSTVKKKKNSTYIVAIVSFHHKTTD